LHRIVVFSSWRAGVPAVLVAALRNAIAARDDFELSAICLPSAPPRTGPARFLIDRLYARINRKRRPLRSVTPIKPRHWSRRHGVAVLYPDEGDFNAPAFAAKLQAKFSPTILFSAYCLQKLGPALLEVFPQTVNYHNGSLPGYRGLRATGWSLYNGEAQSGFAFHRMTEELDAGNVLVTGSVPIAAGNMAADVEAAKAKVAAARLPELLDLLAADAPGEPQNGAARYYAQSDFDRITRIAEPSSLSRDELLLRLRAFRALDLQLGGRWYNVDLLEEIASGRQRNPLCFQTADGAWMVPTSIRSLPIPLYRLRSLLLRD
jgi:folate-dependent phosphoribosylglycinamide formyltransferase PurN